MNLVEYELHVRSLAAKSDGTPLYNESVEHAAIVIENLFAHADDSVDILSGFCNARVFGRATVVEEAQLFLATASTNKLRIILEKNLPEDRTIHPFFQMCATMPNVELRIAPEKLQERYGFHFIVADKRNYRYEDDKTQPAAIAAFGNRTGAENLTEIYEYLWPHCTPADTIAETC